MQSIRQAMTAYGQAAETLAPGRQIVLLYDGAIRRIKEARQAIEERRINDRYVAIAKATAILEGLQGCLDLERGGAIARNLDQIYTYLVLRLARIHLENDVTLCDEVTARLSELRDSWAQIADGSGADRAPGVREPAAISGLTLTI
jgi:flagellar secretion chaperone FliS